MKDYREGAIGEASAKHEVIAGFHAPDRNRPVGINLTGVRYSGEDAPALHGADKFAEGRAVVPDFDVNSKVAEAGAGKGMRRIDKFPYRTALHQSGDAIRGAFGRAEEADKNEHCED